MANRFTKGRALFGKVEADVADGVKAADVILPQYVMLTVPIPVNGDIADGAIFVADRAYKVIQVDEVHSAAGTDAGAVALDIKKQTGTETPAQGVSVLAATFDMKSTANTVVSKSGSDLSATAADLLLAAGDRLSFDFTGTLTALAGLCVTLKLELQ